MFIYFDSDDAQKADTMKSLVQGDDEGKSFSIPPSPDSTTNLPPKSWEKSFDENAGSNLAPIFHLVDSV